MKNGINNCYLEHVDGYLTCTYNHKVGEECLMDKSDSYEETASYTESHEFSEGIPTTVTVQAKVNKSECQSCVEQVNLKDCQDLFKICLDVQ